MKILVLELARLGDIYLSWPALRALRRSQPEAQIDVLTRQSFAVALDGLEAINKKIILPTREMLEPMIQVEADIPESFKRLSQFVDSLRIQKYDWIVNLSFSPFSSYLTHALSREGAKVSGYSRHEDGYLAIPDDISAYFYAQVGVNRSNRLHLCEIFGTMCGVDLVEDDWKAPDFIKTSEQRKNQILFHVGASEAHKQLTAAKISSCINQYLKISTDQVVLIGSKAETEKAEGIMSSVNSSRVSSYVGKTTVHELFKLIAESSAVVGADSAPQHMASLVGTPCLNISFHSVNFWETGPRQKQSQILRVRDENDILSDEFAKILHAMRIGEFPDLGLVTVGNGMPCYQALTSAEADFQWDLVKAIYLGEDFPAPLNPDFLSGMQKLEEVNNLMLDQMSYLKKGGDLQKVAGIINRAEEVIETIAKLVPSLAILVRWYQTEKIRLGPDSHESVLEKTRLIQEKMSQVIQLYRDYEATIRGTVKEEAR